ncbi:MAG: hypothetical protein JO353_08275, partial [Phycisphaerae bacterium]|nr:hypothetical protein [Phycisphaerae bacterium]
MTSPDPQSQPSADFSAYEQERREKREKLRALGVDPYGARIDGLQSLASVRAQYTADMGHDAGPVVHVAGRVMLKRDMGKLSFITLRDETGDLQVALDKRRIDDTAWQVRGLLDLGDQIVVEGPLGSTNKGEITVWATSLQMASKALLPPPAKWEGLSDVELRYRQRYVDLWANPDVMRVMKLRMAIVAEIRAYLTNIGYVEAETPMMQPLAGGAAARPFVTHHNALDIPLYMRIAPELYLKRLLVGGFSKVFELNRNFRNEGISPRHNPEFTMLEAYQAFGSWETMADLVEGMICHIAEKLFGGLKIVHRGGAEGAEKVINLRRPWRKVRMQDSVCSCFGFSDQRGLPDPGTMFQASSIESHPWFKVFLMHAEKAVANGAPYSRQTYEHLPTNVSETRQWLNHLSRLSDAERLVEVYEKLIEPTLIDPCFVTHVPSVIIPLAKKNSDDPFFADVYELAINGQEISPGYSELNDPDVQAANFAHQVGDKDEQQKTDDDFLSALK